jgi:hypothetical protein
VGYTERAGKLRVVRHAHRAPRDIVEELGHDAPEPGYQDGRLVPLPRL